jgi:hypothetical protein
MSYELPTECDECQQSIIWVRLAGECGCTEWAARRWADGVRVCGIVSKDSELGEDEIEI